jgi:integrase
MTRIKLLYVVRDRDRHGNVRLYFRKRGAAKKIRLPGLPGSAEFNAAYAACLQGLPLPQASSGSTTQLKRPTANTLYWLCNAYFQSAEFKTLALNTRTNKQGMLRRICAAPLTPDSQTIIGDLPFVDMTAKAVRMLRDRRADQPGTANNWLAALKTLFDWAIDAELFNGVNPAKDVPKVKGKSDGFHTWTPEEMQQFEARHPIGTAARLAFAILAYTGQRRSDAVILGRQHMTKDGHFRFVQKKNRDRNPVTVEIPILPELTRIIDASQTGDLTFLINDYGQPWTEKGFSNRFKSWCKEAGLPHCSAHGLRKAAACKAAEGGATEMQMMAIFGWRNADMARLYTQRARRAEMAAGAMYLLGDRQNTDGTNVSHFPIAKKSGGTNGAKS